MPSDDPASAEIGTLLAADITGTKFIADPLHWVDLAVRGICFRIFNGDKAVAMLIPVEVNPNGIGDLE